MSEELITTEQLPQYLIDAIRPDGETGLEEMRSFLTPPMLKVVQAKRTDAYKPFAEGSVIVTPTNEIVCAKEGYFPFTVLYTYSQYCVHNSFARPEGLFTIRESTFDFNSEIAQKCRDFVTEPMPEDPTNPKMWIKYATHINALIVIHGIPALENIPVIFSQYLGAWKSGRRMLDLLNARTGLSHTPIYCHNLMAHQVNLKSKENDWEGLDISNPTADVDVGKYVTAEQLVKYKELHDMLKADRDRLVVNYEDEVPQDNGAVESDTL